jgi:3-isopropylmalate/(R)-2-methylmalate dehydratase small subunit
LLPIVLEEKIVDKLFQDAEALEGYQLTVDLEAKTVITPAGESFGFEVDDFRRHCLLNGLDDIGVTLEDAELIKTYEDQRRQTAPWLFDAGQ